MTSAYWDDMITGFVSGKLNSFYMFEDSIRIFDVIIKQFSWTLGCANIAVAVLLTFSIYTF